MRTRAVGLGLMVVSVVLGSMAVVEASQPRPEVGYQLPASLAGGEFVLEPLASRGLASAASTAIAKVDADADAEGYAADLIKGAAPASSQLVAFTDTTRGEVGKDGSVALSFVDVPAWIVRFTGVPQPVFGGVGSAGLPGPVAQELNVVVDAQTGAYLEMFSFR